MASAGGRPESCSDQPRKGLRKDRRLAQEPLQCPVCGVTVRPETLATHYQQELQRLNIRHRKPRCSWRDSQLTLLAVTSTSTVSLAPPSQHKPTDSAMGSRDGASVMQLARAALDATRRRSFLFQQGVSPNLPDPTPSNPTTCAVCGIGLPLDDQLAAAHVEQCLNRETASSSSGSEGYEEYTWCDVTRVRATSMLDAGSRANIFNGTLVTQADEASSCDLDVETDISRLYGPPQFEEEDISRCAGPQVGESPTAVPRASPDKSSHHKAPPPAPPQCLICMDAYTNPVVSVLCWHVYCQQCWLKALATQKLCPTCKTITCPGDLRRIFL